MKINKALILFICFAVFFLFGFLDNLKGPVLPEILKELKISYTAGGNLFFSSYFGFLIATFITGFLSDKIGNKLTLYLSLIILFIGIILFISVNTYTKMIFLIFIFGLGLGAVELTGNKIVIDTFEKKRALYLNLLTFSYSFGAFLSPILAGLYLSRNSTWRSLYKFTLIPIILILLISFLLKVDNKSSNIKKKEKSPITSSLFLIFILMAIYMMAEVGLVSWIVEFLQKSKSFSIKKSNLYLSLFFVTLGCGRLIGSTIVERFGYVKSLAVSAFVSFSLLLMGILLSGKFVFCIPLAGLFYSIMFPTITALVSKINEKGSSLGILFAFAGAGGMLGPALTGLANDFFGIDYGLLLVPFFCICMFLVLFIISKSLNQIN